MTVSHSTLANDAATNAVVDRLDAGSGPGNLLLREGGTLICTVPLPVPAFGDAVDGVAALNGPLEAQAVASTTNGVDGFEYQDGDGNPVWSGTVAESGAGADMDIDNVNINAGQKIAVSDYTYDAFAQ
jgi:hypothetical protein